MENESLREAVQNGDVERVHEVLASGADPNFVDGDGTPPLHIAAAAGNAELAGVLLASGAVVDLPQSSDGATALHVAARRGHHDTVQTLLVYGANVACANNVGATPLHLAAQSGHSRVIELLLASGADPEQTESQGERTALHFAAAEGHHDAARLLIWSGADPNRSDGFGLTALMLACANGHAETVETLLMQGANVNVADPGGETPLMSAIINGHTVVARVMLEQGAGIDAQDSRGMTPLHLAAAQGAEELIDVLLHRGASLTATDASGMTPAQVAEAGGFTSIVEILRRAEAEAAQPAPPPLPAVKPQVLKLSPDTAALSRPAPSPSAQPKFAAADSDITEIQPVAARAPEPQRAAAPAARVRARRGRRKLKPGAVLFLVLAAVAATAGFLTQVRPDLGRLALQKLNLAPPEVKAPPRRAPDIPKLSTSISDFADILDQTNKSEIAGIIEDARKKAGAEIAVVTIDSVQPMKLSEFAGKTLAAWSKAEARPAAVFAVAMDRREVAIEPSAKARTVLSPEKIEELIKLEIQPLLEIGDYRTGIVAGTRAIKRVFAKEPDYKEGVPGTASLARRRPQAVEGGPARSEGSGPSGGYSARILSSPVGAIAVIDRGTYVGQTPLTIELPYGRHVVEIRMAGYVSQRERIWVSQDNMSYTFNLVPVLD